MKQMKKYKVICPLFNFTISTQSISNLGFSGLQKGLNEDIAIDEIKIRRISREDREDLKVWLPYFFEHTASNLFVLEQFIDVEEEKLITVKDRLDFENQVDQVMQNVILALRLLKQGCVDGKDVFLIPISDKTQSTLSIWHETIRHQLVDTYVLNLDEIPVLKKLLDKIQAIDFSKRKSLYLACKRFQRTYSESDPEYQIIDFMIAFEALFLKGEKAKPQSGEIIAIACSLLLGKNEEEREEIRRFLTEAYSIRNCIVHGSEPKFNEDFSYRIAFISKIEEYLRESIKKFLD